MTIEFGVYYYPYNEIYMYICDVCVCHVYCIYIRVYMYVFNRNYYIRFDLQLGSIKKYTSI